MKFILNSEEYDRLSPAQFIILFFTLNLNRTKVYKLSILLEDFQMFLYKRKQLLGTTVTTKEERKKLQEFLSKKAAKIFLDKYKETARKIITYKKYKIIGEKDKISLPTTRYILYGNYIYPVIKAGDSWEEESYE